MLVKVATVSAGSCLTWEICYLHGTTGLGAVNQGFQARVQGADHLKRGQLFWEYLTEIFPRLWIDMTQKILFADGVKHDNITMWNSAEGQDALFPL